MARHETDREDLFAEATALVRRAELTAPAFSNPIVAGFRTDGSLSLYFGPDPVYHFDSSGRLKRAYRTGRLYRTQGQTLAELARERTPAATLLHRRDLPPEECHALLLEMRDHLALLHRQIGEAATRVVRQIPQSEIDLVKDELAPALEKIVHADCTCRALLAPRFKGKR